MKANLEQEREWKLRRKPESGGGTEARLHPPGWGWEAGGQQEYQSQKVTLTYGHGWYEPVAYGPEYSYIFGVIF